jgi:hypothetical protein
MHNLERIVQDRSAAVDTCLTCAQVEDGGQGMRAHALDPVAAIEERELTVAGGSDADLMHDVLTRVLCLFRVDGFIWCDASVSETGRSCDYPERRTFRCKRHSLR